MTKAIYMAIELDQNIMVTNMCLKFGEDWTNSFQELDRKQSSGRTDKGNPICRHKTFSSDVTTAKTGSSFQDNSTSIQKL